MVRVLFLVDGYNVTRGDPATRDLDLPRQRDALVGRLSTRGRMLLGDGALVVVFDGQSGAGTSEVHGRVRVRYAAGSQTADDLVVALAARASEPVTVVTSDRELAARVRTHSAGAPVSVMPREAAYEAARPKPGRTRTDRGLGGSTAGLPKGANVITRELKDLWLDEGEGPADPEERK